jgi:hypothetical protein
MSVDTEDACHHIPIMNQGKYVAGIITPLGKVTVRTYSLKIDRSSHDVYKADIQCVCVCVSVCVYTYTHTHIDTLQ